MLFHEYMARTRLVVGVRGFSMVPILVWVCPDHFWTQGGDAAFSESIRMRPTLFIGTDACGNVACIKGQGLDEFGSCAVTR
jgi:hypothetical protein